MLGLVSHTNLMDALVHPHRRITGLNFRASARRLNNSAVELPESDPILEDTPDIPDESVDYSVFPPDIGRTIIINQNGHEIDLCDTPNKQILSSVFYDNSFVTDDSDDYPFHAVTYGDSEGCFGLSYNDHNYASTDDKSKCTRILDSEDRLSILAKLALAKDEKLPVFTESKCQSHSEFQLTVINPNTTISPKPTSDHIQLNPVSSKCSSFIYNSELPAASSQKQSSLVTTNNRIPTNRTILLSSSRSNPNPPLQIHRVSSSLTPHVVLRTGLPALQIATTAPRHLPTDNTDMVQCVCDSNHMDGYFVKCDQCRTWQHSECVLPANKGRLSTPYLCDQCLIRSGRCTKPVTLQRQKLTTLTGIGNSSNTSIRISRTPALGTTTPSGRIYVTNPLGNTTRQVHVCLPTSQGLSTMQRVDLGFVSTNTNLNHIEDGYQTLNIIPSNQSVRSSKRKQDLITLTGGPSSATAGIEGLSTSPPVSEGYADFSDIQTPFPVGVKGCPTDELSNPACTASNGRPGLLSDYREQAHRSNGGSLQRLLLDYPATNTQEIVNNSEDSHHTSPPCSTLSSSSPITSPADTYEEASDLRLSDRLCHKLDLLFPTFGSLNNNSNTLSGVPIEEIPTNFQSLRRHQVVTFDFNRKGLIATEDICPRSPVIEYRGVCMLLTEYSDMHDYRKHYNPYVLFYKTWSKLALCIDARKYGNEARFIRRSCTPNCEVRHSISFSNDPHSGLTPRLRLIVVATRSIAKTTELTLPFDFDYTACRYLVKCACVRKACPVVRWSQRIYQLNNPLQSPTRSSLLCSRKLSQPSRNGGINGKSRGLSPSQLDCRDKTSNEFKNSSWYGKKPRQNSTRNTARHIPGGPNSADRLWKVGHPSRNHVKDSILLNSLTKTVRRRGRGRGRVRGSSSIVAFNRRNAERTSARFVCRGRPVGTKKALTTTRKRRSLHSSIVPSEGKTSVSSITNNPLIRSLSNNQHSPTSYATPSSSETESITDASLPTTPFKGINNLADSSYFKSDHFKQKNSTTVQDCKLERDYDEDLDADTEPEYDFEQTEPLSNSSISPKKSSHFKQANVVDYKQSSEVKQTTSDTLNDSMRSTDSLQSRNETLNDTIQKNTLDRSPALDDRSKRRLNADSSDTQGCLSRKRTKSREENHDESREEVWMAEVLRRIERMEKKRLKQKKVSEKRRIVCRSNENVHLVLTKAKLKAETEIDKTCSPIEDILSPESNKTDFEHSITLLPNSHQDDSTKFTNPVKVDISDNDVSSSEKNATQFSSSSIGDKTIQKLEESPSESLLVVKGELLTGNSEDSVAQNLATHRRVSFSRSKTKHPKSRNNSRLRNRSPSRQRRRRSQTAMLSDGLSVTSVDQGGSREDRWLQFQLRRIAELEVQEEVSQNSYGETENLSNRRMDDQTMNSDSENTHIKVPIFDSIGIQSDTYTSVSTPSEPKSTNRNRRHTSGISKTITVDSSTDHINGVDGTVLNDGQERIVGDSEADCELIVYRAREKDPMAKFSRSRPETIVCCPTSTFEYENSQSSFNINHELSCKHNDVTLSSFSQHSSRQSPKPTKKRWLSRALMEEDVAPFNGQISAIISTSLSSDTSVIINSKSPPLFNSQSLLACPVNPKKRIISQLSEVTEDPVHNFHQDSDSDKCTYLKKDVQNGDVKPDYKEIPMVSTENIQACFHGLIDEKEPFDSVLIHSAPLPPKKATVKQQAEEFRLQEMRKVRVSLSEYRRRRGLPSLSTSSNQDQNQKEDSGRLNEEHTSSDIENLDIKVPPTPISPTELLRTLPHLPIEQKLPIRFESDDLLRQTKHLEIKRDFPLDAIEPGTYVVDPEQRSTVFLDGKLNTGGPRTPSEPPDDDDDDDDDDEGVGDVNSSNRVSKTALSSSPEPFIQFVEKPCSANDSPTSFLDSRMKSEKITCRNRSPPLEDKRASPKLYFPADKSELTSCSVRPRISAACLLSVHNHSKESEQDRLSNTAITHSNHNMDHVAVYTHENSSSYEIQHHANRKGLTSHSHARLVSQSNIPPPPPPPMPSFSGHSSKSSSASSHDCDKVKDDKQPHSAGALEYFIRRDKEIRIWQETHSLERERRHSSPWPHRSMNLNGSSTRKFCATAKHGLKGFKECDNVFSFPDVVSGQFDNVEQTLWRIRDTLQAQLDLTRGIGSGNPTSSSNSNGPIR